MSRGGVAMWQALGTLLLCAACRPDHGERPVEPAPSAVAEPAPPPAQPPAAPERPPAAEPYPAPPRRVLDDGSSLFGGEIEASAPFVELDALLAQPREHLGTPVRTAGVVQRVCHKRGCWLELAGSGEQSLRVPMAGHAFSIPQRAVGQRAEVQGTLRSSPMPAATREHLAAEGARSLGPLALEATAVRVPAPR